MNVSMQLSQRESLKSSSNMRRSVLNSRKLRKPALTKSDVKLYSLARSRSSIIAKKLEITFVVNFLQASGITIITFPLWRFSWSSGRFCFDRKAKNSKFPTLPGAET